MRRVPVLWAAGLVLAAWTASGCPAKSVGRCGERVGNGVFRYCGTGEEFQCVCGTGRCALADPSGCAETGLRYTDDDECVTAAELGGVPVIPSTGTSAACPASAGDADADGDGDGDADVDAEADGEVGDGEDAEAETEADGSDVPPPTVDEPVSLGPGKDAAVLGLGDRLVVDFIRSDAGDQAVFLQLLNDDGALMGTAYRYGLVGEVRTGGQVHGAWKWTRCPTTPAGGLFVHWVEREEGIGPLILWVQLDVDATLAVTDVTDEVLGVPRYEIYGVNVVGGETDACWVTWIHDPDGLESTAESSFVQVRRFDDPGSIGTSYTLLDTMSGDVLEAAPMMPGDGVQAIAPPATVDGSGGVIVAAPARDAASGETYLMGQGWLATDALRFGGMTTWAQFGAPCVEPCEGIEAPEFGVMARSGNFVQLLYVVVDGAPGTDRHLMRQTIDLTMNTVSAPTEITGVTQPVRGPSLVASGGRFFGTFSTWSGTLDLSGAAISMVLAPPTLAPSVVVGQPGAYAVPTPDLAGGIYLLWYNYEEADPAPPGDDLEMLFRLSRLDSGLAAAPGWPVEGIRPYDATAYSFGGNPSRHPVVVPVPGGGVVTAFTNVDGLDTTVEVVRVRETP